MNTKVIINGANGRMGSEAVLAIENDPTLELVGKTGKSDSLAAAIKQTSADVIVDLTTASSAYENSLTIIRNNCHPVIGTSGLLPAQIQELKNLCAKKKIGALIVPNFSISAVLMMKISATVAEYLNHVEIIEMHHDKKEESPSGTAIKTAELLSRHIKQPRRIDSKELLPGARGAICEDIPIHSVRLPGILAHQEIIFGSEGETLKIQHTSIDRKCFMPGLLLSCKKVTELDHLVYGLENII